MADNELQHREEVELKQIVRQISHTDRMHHCCIEKRIQQMGIHRNQHMILMHLARNDKVLSQNELADFFRVSKAAIANTMKNLEKSGYISRVTDTEDSRKNIINITEKGRRIVEMSRSEFDTVDKAMFRGVTKEQLDVFCEVLDIFQNNLHRLEGVDSDEQILKNERMRQK